MPVQQIVAEVAALSQADPATCDRAGIADLVAKLARVRGRLDAIEATVARRAAELAADGSGDPAAAVLAGGGRRSGRDARAAAARGDICAAIPELHDALASGTVSAGHVDAVARAAAHLDDTGKADLAALGESLVAGRGRRRWRRSNARSATSNDAYHATTASAGRNRCAGNDHCAAGSTTRPG